MKDDTLIDDFSLEEEAEIRAIREKMHALITQYPICHLITKTIHSHWRLQQLKDLKAPIFVIEKEIEIRDEYLERLMQAFPLDTQEGGYFLNGVVDALHEEILLPAEKVETMDA